MWEGSNVIAEYGDAPGGPGGTRFYHPDRLSTRTITDGNGAVKGTMDNLPFGEDGGFVGETEKHRFTSYEHDVEIGNDYAVNRQYSSGNGRFNRPDAVTGSTATPQSLNRYAYALGDPISLVDPLGLTVNCPAQFAFCGVATVDINGIRYDVPVGFSRSGSGSFLWHLLPILDRIKLSDMRLPKGFSLSPSLSDLIGPGNVFDRGARWSNGIVREAQNQVWAQIRKEIDDCARAGREGVNGSEDGARKFLEFIGKRVEGKVKYEAYKALARSALERGLVSGESFVGRQLFRFSKGAIVTPAGVALLFLQLSYEMAPTNEEMEISRINYHISQDCKEAVLQKYGIQP